MTGIENWVRLLSGVLRGFVTCHPLGKGQVAELSLPRSESRSLAKVWLVLEVGNTHLIFHASDTSFPPSVPQGTRTSEIYWSRGPWKLRLLGMVLNELFWSVHVQDSPSPSVKSESPATLEEVSVHKNI